MNRFVAKRIVSSLFILLLVTFITFILVRLIPGHPIQATLQHVDLTDQKIVEEMRSRDGLDKSIPTQFCIWLWDSISGDWGRSMQTGEPVLDMFWKRLPITVELFLGATFWAWIIGFPLGVLSALGRNSAIDICLRSNALVGVSVK